MCLEPTDEDKSDFPATRPPVRTRPYCCGESIYVKGRPLTSGAACTGSRRPKAFTEAASQEWHGVRSWRIFSSLPLNPLSSKPQKKSCWRPRKEPIGGTDRPEDLSEQSLEGIGVTARLRSAGSTERDIAGGPRCAGTSKEKGGSVGGSGQCLASHEGTQSCNGLADDQRVHLPCALIGVDCFGIGHEASDVVLEQDAVAAEQLARITDGFAAFDRAERLRERRMLIAHHTFVLKFARRSIIAWVDVTLPSMRTSRSWTSWNPPMGLPNCVRSVA